MSDYPTRQQRVVAENLLSGESVFGFHHYGESWWHKKEGDHIQLGAYNLPELGGGAYGEFGIAWEKFGDGHTATQLKAYDDAWAMFPFITDLFGTFAELSESSSRDSVTPLEFVERLKAMGWVDLTERVQGVPATCPRKLSHGAIPEKFLELFPGYSHYAGVNTCDPSWVRNNLSGESLYTDHANLLLLTTAEDAMLTHLAQ